MMKQILAALGATFLSAGLAYAQATAPAAPAASCEARAVSKTGTPLSGAAKASFIKKCETDSMAAASCEAKAVGKNGKPLAGAAKASFMKKCEADAAK